jgi:hypothetical protein
MTDSRKSQYASVSYPFPVEEPPVIYCPLCGNPTFNLADGGDLVINPCQHLAFVFFGRPSEFIYQSQDFQHRTSAQDLKGVTAKEIKGLIETLGYDNKFLALEVSYGDMGDAENWYTDIYGFDYSTYC